MNRLCHALFGGAGALCLVASTLSATTLLSASFADPSNPLSSSAAHIALGQTSLPRTFWLDVNSSNTATFRSASTSSPRQSGAQMESQRAIKTAALAVPPWENQVDNSMIVDVLKQEHQLKPITSAAHGHGLQASVKVEPKSPDATSRRSKQADSVRTETRQPSFIPSTGVADAPSDLIPVYKAAGVRFGIPWTVLAAIHKTETGYRTSDCPVSSAGAEGPMQFEPSTFEAYAVAAPGHSSANIQNVDDAIYTAAKMLDKDGFSSNPSAAIFAYNHSKWYVNRIETLAGIA